MKKLVLTSIGDIKNLELTNMFEAQGLTLVKRKPYKNEQIELIFYCSPESYLTFFNTPESKVVDKLNNWKDETLTLLEYVIANPENCLLIELDFAIQNQQEFCNYVKESIGITLTPNSIDCFKTTKLIQSCMLLIDDDVQDVYEDVTAAADLYNKEGNNTVRGRLHLYLNILQKDIDVLEKSQLHQVTENNKAIIEADNLTVEPKSIKTKNNEIKIEKTALSSENELALLQIHQLQEELEAVFVKKEQLKTQLDGAVKEAKANRLIVESKPGTAEGKNSSTEEDQLRNEIAQLISENELALLQIHQLQEELEFYFMQLQNKKLLNIKQDRPVANLISLKPSLQLAKLLH